MENGAKVSLEEEPMKTKAKNTELQSELQSNQEDLQTIQRNYAMMSGKVMGLEKDVKAGEEQIREATEREMTSKETAVLEIK